VIVPAGHLALHDYEDLNVYVCQAGRTFRTAHHLGLYAGGQIHPRIPKILRQIDKVALTPHEVARLRGAGDDQLADVVEAFATDPNRRGHRGGPHKVILLSGPEDEDTIKLAQPIKHLVRGRGKAYARRHRYTTVAALGRQPATTAELIRYEQE
jgi:hypothetical protein